LRFFVSLQLQIDGVMFYLGFFSTFIPECLMALLFGIFVLLGHYKQPEVKADFENLQSRSQTIQLSTRTVSPSICVNAFFAEEQSKEELAFSFPEIKERFFIYDESDHSRGLKFGLFSRPPPAI
jgi:hypothetical protein